MGNLVVNDNYDFFEGGAFKERRYTDVEKCDCTLNLGLEILAGHSHVLESSSMMGE